MNTCQYCKKLLSSKYYLQTHEKTCVNNKNEEFKCQYCENLMSTNQTLKTHEKTCTEKEEFRCQYCEKLLLTKQTWEKHEEKCKELKLNCNYCNKVLRTKQNLKKHEKTCKQNKDTEETKKEIKEEIKEETKKTKKELKEKLKEIEEQNIKITSDLEKQKLKEQFDKKEISNLNNEKNEVKFRYEKELNELKKINSEFLQMNKETLKSVIKTNTDLSKKPNNINISGRITTINNNNCLSVETSKKILSDFFAYYKEVIENDDVDNIITSNADMINALYLTNDLKKILTVTDPSRNVLKYNIIDENNEMKTIKDPRGKYAAKYLIDNNQYELKNIIGATSDKKKFVAIVMNKGDPQNASNFFPILDKYGQSLSYFMSISNKDTLVLEDLGLQLVKKSLYKDHKEINDQKEEDTDVLLKCQNTIMKLKIYTENNYQDILTGNTFAVNIWLRAALKELKVLKEWYVSDIRVEDYILLKDDKESAEGVRLHSFDVMRMLQMIMKPNLEDTGLGKYVEKYIKWLCKSYNKIYKNIDEDTRELIIEQAVEQMKKNIILYNRDFETEKEEVLKNWMNVIRG